MRYVKGLDRRTPAESLPIQSHEERIVRGGTLARWPDSNVGIDGK